MPCHVIKPSLHICLSAEENYGTYYTQLGCAKTLPEIRTMMEERTGVTGNALRIEQAVYCPKEGKSKTGCPVAKEASRFIHKRLIYLEPNMYVFYPFFAGK